MSNIPQSDSPQSEAKTKDTEATSPKNAEHKNTSADQKEESDTSNTATPEQTEIQDLQEKLLRCTADMQNIKRRSQTDQAKARFDGAISTLRPSLDLLDNISRAFAHIPEDIKNHEFIASLQSIESSFIKTLEESGVQFFGAEGEIFDPEWHESLLLDNTKPKDTIAQVFEKGVQYKTQVVRHAKVSVGTEVPKKEETVS